MKKNIIISIGVIISIQINAQNIPIKEEHDLYSYNLLYNRPIGNYDPCAVSANNDQDIFGDGMSMLIEGYLTLHETTGDKGYLYKYIFQSLCMMENRHDYAGINSEPRWSELMYQDGYIIASFAKFVHYIKIENPGLYNKPLYQFDELNSTFFGINFQTFGQYADWLQDRCGETLWWYIINGYWDDNYGMLTQPVSNTSHIEIAHINMQIGFGRAFLFIGLTAAEEDFIDKALVISDLFKSDINIIDLCLEEGGFYFNSVLILKSNNSYWWYHNGWRVTYRTCLDVDFDIAEYPNYGDYVQYVEDISHGAHVTYLAYDFYNFQPNSTFNLTDMIRFRNTFTKNIYDGAFGFYESVNGEQPVATDPFQLDISALNYSVFSDFDGMDATTTTPNAYDIIMDYYENFMLGATLFPSGYGGQANKGHAELVREQWERECVNLSLYNRNVIYDQDFFVKNILTFEPEGGNGISYAEPTITTPEFIINENIHSNITAGEYISLKPGVQFKSGSVVNLKINPNICTDGEIGGGNENKNLISFESQKMELERQINDWAVEFDVFPNPMQENFQIELKLKKESFITLSIYDITGELILQQINNQKLSNGLHSYVIDSGKWSVGMYFCVLSTDSRNYLHKKIIKSK